MMTIWRSRRVWIHVVCMIALAIPLASAQELLTNPSFETVGENGVPEGWKPYGGRSEVAKVLVVDEAFDGTRSVRFIDTGPEERKGSYSVGLTQTFPAVAEAIHVVSVRVKTRARNHGEALLLQLRFQPGNTIKQIHLPAEVGGDWTPFTLAALAPKGTTAATLYLYTMHYWTVDTLLDDVSVRTADLDVRDIRNTLLLHGRTALERSHPLNLATPVVTGGKPAARILVPEGGAFVELGARLASAIGAKTGVAIPVTTTYAGTVESTETVIALGNLNNNRLVERLYFNQYLAIDGLKPGPGKYILQTVHEPYNGPRGKNVIVIGASDTKGLRAGVDAFIERLPAGPELVLTKPLLVNSGHRPLSDAAGEKLLKRSIGQDALAEFWRAAQTYRDTGDLYHAKRAKRILLYCGDRVIEKPDYHVTWPEETTSKMLGAMWDVLEEAPIFTEAERLRCLNTLLATLCSLPRQVSGYGALDDNDTLIWNHTTFPLIGIYWLARYFDRYYADTRGHTKPMLSKVHAAFEGQVVSWKPQEDSLGYYSIVPLHTIEYTLAENDYRYFENGSVKQHADYTIAICDNTGDAAGFGDSGYGRHPYIRNIHWALWYYKDGRYLWWLNKVLPKGYESPYDPEVREQKSPEIQGVKAIPLHPEVYRFTQNHRSYSEPIAPPNIPLAKAFDKISFRENLDPNGEYFLLDGYSRGKHLQYDGNAIIKFWADGQDWLVDGDYLVRNTTDHNMVSIIRDGRCDRLIPSCTGLEAIADLDTAGLTQTIVHDYNGVDWIRNIVWLKGEFVVVVDEVEAREEGDYTVVGNWKTMAEGAQDLRDGRMFRTARFAAGHSGSRGLATVTAPAEGIGRTVRFGKTWSQLDTEVDLPDGQYQLTLFALGSNSGDSFFVRIDGGKEIPFHIPVDAFGPSSDSWTKDTPTPNVTLTGPGKHRVTITLREGPGPFLDRFVFKDAQGREALSIEAEDAPPLTETRPEQNVQNVFYVKNDGAAANRLTGRINHTGRRITYLRQRTAKHLKPGERTQLVNVFYNDSSEAPKDYDVRRTATGSVVVLKQDVPVALVTAGPEGTALPGISCALRTVTERHAYLAGVQTLPGVLTANMPIGVELDLENGTLAISAPASATVRTASGRTVTLEHGKATIDVRREPGFDALCKQCGSWWRAIGEAVVSSSARAVRRSLGAAALKTVWESRIPISPDEEDAQPILELSVDQPTPDGASEILVLRGKSATCLDTGGEQRWRFSAEDTIRAAAMGDIDGNGTAKRLLGADDEMVYVLGLQGKLERKHHPNIPLRVGMSSVRQPKVADIAIGDLESDGTPDIVVCLLNGNLLRYDREFSLKWRYNAIPHGSRELTFVDLNRDGKQEILLANKYGAVQIFSADGAVQRGLYSELGDVEMAYGNLDADPAYEIACGSSTGAFTCTQYGGKRAFEFPNFGFGVRETLMADVSGDGRDELLIASETGYVYVLDGSGNVLAKRDFGSVVADLCVLSVPKRTKPVIALCCEDGQVYVMDGQGRLFGAASTGASNRLVVSLPGHPSGARILVATATDIVCLQL
ncbi:MAG: hypothetical protein HN742_01430 [Lentisphaerae bacterium]|jgi:hypothetical protein|nr:hypothetical protein [Lentisphaerota bacterium]MBT5611747.1 hypothetical protein [Lentisphaerota bacterium]MBT7055839.1 hypothetical protein [Lentisphaerota bacterium]MBT7840496.1 hypothetical protein [Lentisphaerota bacterium]